MYKTISEDIGKEIFLWNKYVVFGTTNKWFTDYKRSNYFRKNTIKKDAALNCIAYLRSWCVCIRLDIVRDDLRSEWMKVKKQRTTNSFKLFIQISSYGFLGLGFKGELIKGNPQKGNFLKGRTVLLLHTKEINGSNFVSNTFHILLRFLANEILLVHYWFCVNRFHISIRKWKLANNQNRLLFGFYLTGY